jgi:hypothetical protein
MLGEQIGEENGKVTVYRVLPTEGSTPKVEVSFQTSGTLLGRDTTDLGTYVSVVNPDGTLHGEGQGIVTTAKGDVVTWRGEGVGRFTGRQGTVSWRGAVYYRTASPELARLNTVAAIFEYEVEGNGNTHAKLWEWK